MITEGSCIILIMGRCVFLNLLNTKHRSIVSGLVLAFVQLYCRTAGLFFTYVQQDIV